MFSSSFKSPKIRLPTSCLEEKDSCLLVVYHVCTDRWTFISERIIEDHEKLINVMMNWQKISTNKILFLETDDKYDLFFQPQVRDITVTRNLGYYL